MNENKDETTLTSPPKDQTQMVSAVAHNQKKGQKTYKLFVLRPFQLGSVEYGPMGAIIKDTTRMTKVGEIVDVERTKAKELCSKIQGPYAFSGLRYNKDGDNKRHDMTRARLATPADLVKKEALTPFEADDVFAD